MGKKKLSKCAIAAIVICSAFVVTAGLLVAFLFPRMPSVEVVDKKINSFELVQSPPSLQMNMEVIVNVSNPNFVDIQGNELVLDIYYQGYDIGTVDKKDFVFTKLSNSTHQVPVLITAGAEQSVAIGLMAAELATSGKVQYRAKGNITVTYIVVTVTIDLEFEFDASP
jgi:hypothetical protein